MLIRRVGGSGRRVVSRRLDWIRANMRGAQDQQQWKRFLYAATALFFPTMTINDIPADEDLYEYLEAHMRAAGRTEWEPMLPWLFKNLDEFKALPRATKNNIRDWYVGPRRRPQIMGMSVEEVVQATEAYHGEIQARAQKTGVLAGPERVRAVFRPVRLRQRLPREFKGWKWRKAERTDDPLYDTVAAVMEVGRRLGHCYADSRHAHDYISEYDLYTLFDDHRRPRLTINVDPLGPAVEQARASNNRALAAEDKYSGPVTILLEEVVGDPDSTWWGEAEVLVGPLLG